MPILISNNFPPEVGGIQRVLANIASVMNACGNEMIVVAPSHANAVAHDRDVPYAIKRYPVIRERFSGMLAMVPTYFGAVRSATDKTTIIAAWWPNAIPVLLIPRFLRGPYVIFAFGSEIAPSKRGFRRHAMRFVYRHAHAVLAISTYTKDLLRETGVVANIEHVSMAIDIMPIEPNRATVPTILSVGRLVRRKGFDRTIEAIAALAEKFPDLRYSIVGDGPQRSELVELAKRLGVAERVTFHGTISDDELITAYAQAWIFALPVRRDGDDVEGFGLVYLEAAMAEVPSIGGRSSGASDAIVDGETGLLVDGDDTASIARAISRFLLYPNDRAAMGRAARMRAETFTWERTVSEIKRAIANPQSRC